MLELETKFLVLFSACGIIGFFLALMVVSIFLEFIAKIYNSIKDFFYYL